MIDTSEDSRLAEETSSHSIPEVNPTRTHVEIEYKHNRPLVSCHWSRNGQHIFFGAEDNIVHRFDLSSRQVVEMPGHDSWVRAIGTAPDGSVCYSGGYDGRLIWWPGDAETPKPMRVVDAHSGWIRALAVNPTGDVIATCGNDNAVRLWKTSDGSLIHTLSGHASHVYNVAFSPDGASILSCDLKANVKLWNPATGDLKADLPVAAALHKYDTTFRADIGGARSMAFRADGKAVALGGITNVTNAFAGIGEVAVVLMNVADNKIDIQLESKAKTRGSAWGVAWHPNEFWIGLSGGGGGGWLIFWKEDNQHEFFQLKLKSDGRGMSVAPDQRHLAVAHYDMHLRTYALTEA